MFDEKENSLVPPMIKQLWANFAKQAKRSLSYKPAKEKLKPRLAWDSSVRGTYCRKSHGELK